MDLHGQEYRRLSLTAFPEQKHCVLLFEDARVLMMLIYLKHLTTVSMVQTTTAVSSVDLGQSVESINLRIDSESDVTLIQYIVKCSALGVDEYVTVG